MDVNHACIYVPIASGFIQQVPYFKIQQFIDTLIFGFENWNEVKHESFILFEFPSVPPRAHFVDKSQYKRNSLFLNSEIECKYHVKHSNNYW